MLEAVVETVSLYITRHLATVSVNGKYLKNENEYNPNYKTAYQLKHWWICDIVV